MIEIKAALRSATAALHATSDSASFDAQLLLAHVLEESRTFLYTYPNKLLTPFQWEHYQQVINLRKEGTPVAYLLGQREFWSLPLRVTDATLIPRPETELLVERALTLLPTTPDVTVLDLGTGSGAIALALASERPAWQILACDKSEAALDVAKTNAQALGITNVTFYHSDWFNDLPRHHYHLIVSNPPYLSETDTHLSRGDIRFEPRQALVSGPSGLECLYSIIEHGKDFFAPDGLLLLEHGFEQGGDVTGHLLRHGYRNVQCWPDFAGSDRVCSGWLSKENFD